MQLHELTSDQILEQIEKRSDKLSIAELREAELDTNLKAYEATCALTIKDSLGCSMTEAEKRVKASENWAEMDLNVKNARIETAKIKRSYQLACTASDMWRSENASRRHA